MRGGPEFVVKHLIVVFAVAAGAWFAPACPAASPEPTEAANAPVPAASAPPAPSEFAFTFSPGYGTIDHWPKDPAVFEDVVQKLAGVGFNTIHCVYRDWRVPICRRHGVKMMIDVLAWHDDALTDIRRPEQRAAVKTICEKVRGEPAVWGYNLWNEKLAFFGRPFGKDVNDCLAMLREWDPTHPVWVGTYRNSYPQAVKGNPGVFGYYDYHWQRGMIWHFALLKWYQGLLNERDAWLGRWIMVHDENRNLYTLNTSLAHGLKVVIWFIGGPWNARTGEWNPKHHLVRVGRQVHHLYAELMRLGRPTAVYSTPTTKTPDNKDKEPGVPPHCTPFPDDGWVQVTRGEAVVGLFAYRGGADALFVANHNAFAPQRMVVQFKAQRSPSGPTNVPSPVSEAGLGTRSGTRGDSAGARDSHRAQRVSDRLAVNLFDRQTGAWRPLTVTDGAVTFDLAPAAGELLRVSGRAGAGHPRGSG